MSHYFIEDRSIKHDIRRISYRFAGREFVFTTDSGLFSKDHIDPATDILLRSLPPLSGSLLDMGCGYGCVGIVLASTYPLALTQSDVNPAALALTRLNCDSNGVASEVVLSDCFENLPGAYDTVIINPPIHAGKAVTYRMYEDSYSHLAAGGKLYIVTLRQHGAESTRDKLCAVYGHCETIYKKKGVFVFCCEKIGN